MNTIQEENRNTIPPDQVPSLTYPATPPPSPSVTADFLFNEEELAKHLDTKLAPKNLTENDKKQPLLKNVAIKEESKLKPTKENSTCFAFAGVDKFAHHFVDNIIDKSIKVVKKDNQLKEANITNKCVSYSAKEDTDTLRPTIANFTKKLGFDVVNDCMQRWKYKENWLYCVNFLIEQSDECSDYYLYEAIWSIPTSAYPIPQATASVYFTIEVSRVKPATCLVDVLIS